MSSLETRPAAVQAAYDGDVEGVITALRDLDEAGRAVLRKGWSAKLKARLEACGGPFAEQYRALPEAERLELFPDLPDLPAQPTTAERRARDAAFHRHAHACRVGLAGIVTGKQVQAIVYARKWLVQNEGLYLDGVLFDLGRVLVGRGEPADWEQIDTILHDPVDWGLASRIRLALWLQDEGFRGGEETIAAVAMRLGAPHFVYQRWQDPRWPLAWLAVIARNQGSLASRSEDDPLQPALHAAVAQEHVTREQVVEALRAAVQARQAATDVEWCLKRLPEFGFGEDEWRAEPERVLDLLSAPSAPAMRLGARLAEAMIKNGTLPPAEVLPILPAPLADPRTAVAEQAVKLLRNVSKRHAELRFECLALAVDALTHPQDKVAEAVLGWLEAETDWQTKPLVTAALQGMLETLPAPRAARVTILLQGIGAAAEVSGEPDYAAEVARRVAGLLASERDAARQAYLRTCAAALEGRGVVPYSHLPAKELWRLDAPFGAPENAEATARLLLALSLDSRPATLDQRRLIAGVYRPIPSPERDRVARLVEPILGRVRGYPERLYAEFVQAWLDDDWSPPKAQERIRGYFPTALDLAGKLMARGGGQPRPGLWLPTQAPLWLDPEVFVERLGRGPVELTEVYLAFTLLAPGEGRARALAALPRSLEPWLADCIAVALGGSPRRLRWGRGAPSAPADSTARLLVGSAPVCAAEWQIEEPKLLILLDSTAHRAATSPEATDLWYGLARYGAHRRCPLLRAGRWATEWDLSYDWPEVPSASDPPDLALRVVLQSTHREEYTRKPAEQCFQARLDAGLVSPGLLATELAASLAGPFDRVLALRIADSLAERSAGWRETIAGALEQVLAQQGSELDAKLSRELLDRLLRWRAAGGRAVLDAQAREFVARLAGDPKRNRSQELARQLQALPAGSAAAGAARLQVAEEVATALLRHGFEAA